MLLSACSLLEETGLQSDRAASGRDAAGDAEASPADDFALPAGGAPHRVASAPRAHRAPVPRPKPSLIAPRALVGLTQDEVRGLIGPPLEVADRPPSTVWSYHSKACDLDVFFYLEISTRTFRALTYEVRQADGTILSPPLCLRRIRETVYGG